MKESIHSIEWTPNLNGIVKAKLDSIADWDYAPCYDIRFARDVGMAIINSQKKEREAQCFLDEESEYYYDLYVDGYSGA